MPAENNPQDWPEDLLPRKPKDGETFMPEEVNRLEDQSTEAPSVQTPGPIQKEQIIPQNGQEENIPQKSESKNDDIVPYVIPNENRYSLIAFVLGVFAFFPFIGVLPGIPSIIFGIMGLNFINEHPGAKGTYHAWVGIIGGIIGITVTSIILYSIFNG